MPSVPNSQLPRLLYIGDVPVTNTFAGGALLYRLLSFYPADKLAIICPVAPGMTKLPGVRYYHWGVRFPRLLRSRFSSLYCLWRTWRYHQIPCASRVAASFRPQAVLSISHACSWLQAARLAMDHSIPFHLIAHDDHAYTYLLPEIARPWGERNFAAAYREAHSRFCISQAMADAYSQRYGVPARVMYPTRDPANPVYDEVAPRTVRSTESLTFAYAGSIYGESGFGQILAFARTAGALGHRLLVYSPQHADLMALTGPASAFMDVHAPISTGELLRRLREEADCLVLLQSHAAHERSVLTTLFPTKFADYSAIGLPILAWAPPYTAVAGFVRENGDCAELVTDADAAALGLAIQRLAASPERRRQLAETIIEIGRHCFSPEAAWGAFSICLVERTLEI